ncbi:MAG TPA: serine/threonine-protein kinase [Polyangiaceae bacterium]|nr:serine/threonine-protein kinase [Polyangiaceae bacterium]
MSVRGGEPPGAVGGPKDVMADRISSSSPASTGGRVIQSDFQRGVTYRLERQIGEGGMGAAYLALRQAPDGLSPVVVKLVRPAFGPNSDRAAALVVQKESVALGRLNERVPPCPFVVRLVDTGAAHMHGPQHAPTPWLAVEYVHGGVEGTTLMERVSYHIEKTGEGFDGPRTAHLVRCLASGLTAIHGVGVVHRDLTPGNILCCGFGEAEIFKISDFGIARPSGLSSTFGGVPVGTIGYAAPEQCMPDLGSSGVTTDLFSFACCVYLVLTGDEYFPAETPVQAMVMMRDKKRKSVLEGRALSPELRKRAEACRAIDSILARATALAPDQRHQDAQELANALIPWLSETREPPKPNRRLVSSLLNLAAPGDVSSWTWTVRHPPGGDRVILSAAWDVDGHCFAFTSKGPEFWNGQDWVPAHDVARDLPAGMAFARRFEAGGWLVGGEAGTLAVYTTEGVREVVRCPDPQVTFSHASGRFDDLLAAVGQRPGEPPKLWAMAARRWLKPLPLDGASYVAALLRLDSERWVICGRLQHGTGFCSVYTPTQWETTVLLTPRTRAFVSGASEQERGLALVVGSDGVALRIEGQEAVSSVADGTPGLTAAAMDVLDREWVCSLGRLWVRDPARDLSWRPVWHDPNWQAPFVSMIADAGMVVAMTADGAILEGRAGWRSVHGHGRGSGEIRASRRPVRA